MSVRIEILKKIQFCVYCESTEQYLEIDHIVPVKLGGTNELSNLTVICHWCNSSKNDRRIFYWLERLLKKRDYSFNKLYSSTYWLRHPKKRKYWDSIEWHTNKIIECRFWHSKLTSIIGNILSKTHRNFAASNFIKTDNG